MKVKVLSMVLLILLLSVVSFGAPLKIGVLYLSSINDAGWNTAHYNGIKAMEKTYKGKVSIQYVDGVGANQANITNVLNSLIVTGNKLIFATAWDFMNPVVDASKQYPSITFEHCSGYKRTKNVGTYFARMYNQDYLAGIVAGRMTKNNKIGMVLPQPIPEVIREADAFAIGVASVNSLAKVYIVWTHSWYDPAKESEFARALIESGVDVIAHGCDSPAVNQVANELGVLTIGYGNDQSKFAPKTWLTAPVWNWGTIYKSVVKDYLAGTWQSKAIWDKHGAILLPLSNLVDNKTKQLVEFAKKKIYENNYNIFSGELYDNKGNLKVQAGESLSDDAIWNIFWLVSNIVGTIPK